jgi:adenylyltransferase/sulfurtransferase
MSAVNKEYQRYSCQINLPGFGVKGQEKVANAKVFIAGAGGLGCPAALYLAASGVGTIAIADYDVVSTSNLHRQILYAPSEIGSKKVRLACEKLKVQNPAIEIIEHDVKITVDNVIDLIKDYDIIVDCTDNFETRYLLNDAAVLSGKPLVYGAIYQYEGQVSVWNILNEDGTRTPNYRDLFPEVDSSQVPNCTEGGVIPTLAGMIGCMQANEVLKFITNSGDLITGKLLMLDAWSLQTRIIKIANATKTKIASLQPSELIRTISLKEFKVGEDSDAYQLVDIRNENEREAFNIGGDHIPLMELEKEITRLDTSKKIVFYCASGKRSAEAVKISKKIFPTIEAFSLEGGLKAIRQDS